MAFNGLFKKKEHKGFTACEILTLIYMVITTIMTVGNWDEIDHPLTLLAVRAGILAGMGVLYLAYRLFPCRLTWLLRSMFPLVMLAYWYPETYNFARCYPYYDHVFAQADMDIWGFQPSIEFSKAVTSLFWCEALNMGYYSYYFMMGGVLLFCLLARFKDSERYIFIFLGSFFIYYLIFEFLPVAGPYYYFKAIGLDAARRGDYPDLGHYFATHGELIHAEVRGIFSKLVYDIQVAGENPVGAFPSSHVSMSTVTMLIAWHTRNRWLFWCLMPLYLLLCVATVYIMAHYTVDTIAGLVSAVMLYYLMNWFYRWLHRHH